MSSPPSPQQFCLRWNNHQSALVSVFEHLLQNEAFVDVTFAVEGVLVRAHKLVLSACSPYFQVMLATHPSKHPIIILQEVCYTDFRALLDFMYKGEVAVDQDRLPAFLRLAENLKIRGLAEFCDESNNANSSDHHLPRGPEVKSNSGFVFDSLVEERKLQQSHLPGSPVVDLLSRSVGFTSPALIRRPDLSSSELGLAGLGLFSTPLAFAAQKSRFGSPASLSSSSSSKWPLEPQTYAHHRRKRGRPPRHSGLDRCGSLGSDPAVHRTNSNFDGCSSDVAEVKKTTLCLDENSDSLQTDGVQTEETESKKPRPAEEDDKAADDKGWRSPSPSLESHLEVAIDEDTADTKAAEDSEPTPGTSSQAGKDQERVSESPDIKLSPGKVMRRPRGRPKNHGKDDSIAGDERAGPSQDAQRPCFGSGGSGNTEQLQEMSVRGLNLFRYASISEEGVYRCIPCEKEQITRTFKNKYSFQRHAYLYHEGNQRKVFPCLVCGREFSRPDKLKHHLKTVHDYAVPREYGNAYYSVP